MISRKTLVILGVTASLAVVAAAFLSRERSAPVPAALFPDLPRRVKDVAQIRLASAQGEVTLDKRGDRWVVKEKWNFPASNAKLREALQGVAGLSEPEAKTRDANLYDRVGLDPGKGGKPMLLEMRDGSGKAVITLWIGRSRALAVDVQRNEYFVRRGDEDQVWRVEGRLPSELAPDHWIEKQVLHLARGRLRALSVNPGEGPAFRVSRETAAQAEFTVEGMAAGENAGSPLRVASLVAAVENLSADDVLNPETAASLPERGRLTAETFDGLRVDVRLYAMEKDRYARLSATGSGADTVVQEAAQLNERWHGWTYRLADYQTDGLFAKRSEMVGKQESVPAAAPTGTDSSRRDKTPARKSKALN